MTTTVSELVFQEVKSRSSQTGRRTPAPYVLIRRPSAHTKDGLYTIGKIRPEYQGGPRRWRDPMILVGWRLELNHTLSFQEVAEVYLAMTGMMETINADD